MRKKILGINPDFKREPVSKTSVNIKFYTSEIGGQVWSPIIYRNAAFYYENESHLEKILRKISKTVKDDRLYNNVEAHIISSQTLNEDFQKKLLHLNKAVTITNSDFKNSLKMLNVLRMTVKNLMKDRKELEALRRVTIVCLWLTDDEAKELKNNQDLQESFLSIVENSKELRIFPFLLTRDARNLPENILKAFEFNVFIGERNDRLCRAIWGNSEVEIYNELREVVGILQKKGHDNLIPIHYYRGKPSELKRELDRFRDAKEEAYRKLLESL